MNIRTKDLNLLASLLVIGEELNLSRAATRLHLSQPALSHALSRLREQFGDPLFVRGQRGLVPTPKVGLLLPRVRELIRTAEGLYGLPEKLNLAKVERTIVIASTNYFEARVVADIVIEAQKTAPGLRFETRSLVGGFPRKELESGEYDLAVAAYFDDIPNGYRVKTVYRDRFVCVSSKSNPYLMTRKSLGDYVAARHLQIDVPPGVFAPVDEYLRGVKKKRQIDLRIGNFLTPPEILSRSKFLLTCPSSLAETYRKMFPLAITELPFPLSAIETKMVWHEKNQEDSFHTWLRRRVGGP